MILYVRAAYCVPSCILNSPHLPNAIMSHDGGDCKTRVVIRVPLERRCGKEKPAEGERWDVDIPVGGHPYSLPRSPAKSHEDKMYVSLPLSGSRKSLQRVETREITPERNRTMRTKKTIKPTASRHLHHFIAIVAIGLIFSPPSWLTDSQPLRNTNRRGLHQNHPSKTI